MVKGSMFPELFKNLIIHEGLASARAVGRMGEQDDDIANEQASSRMGQVPLREFRCVRRAKAHRGPISPQPGDVRLIHSRSRNNHLLSIAPLKSRTSRMRITKFSASNGIRQIRRVATACALTSSRSQREQKGRSQ